MKSLHAIALSLSLCAAPALAEVEVAKPKSDADNHKGDTVSFGTTIHVKTVKLGDGAKPADGCIAAGTPLVGLGRVAVPTSDGKGAEERALFRVGERSPGAAADPGCTTPPAAGSSIAVSTDVLSTIRSRSGWSFGTLTVPYKYQIRGDRSLSGSATLGGYMGRRTELLGLSQQSIVFAGLTKVDVPVTQDGQSGTEQQAGLSYGIGSLWSVKDAFQVGLVVGWDRVAKTSHYVNNGKAWVSLSLGYDFYN